MDALYYAAPAAPAPRCCFGSHSAPIFSYPPSVAAQGVIRAFPLNIKTPLMLTAGSWLWLVAPWPVKVITNGSAQAAQIACGQAVYFKAQSDTWIVPTKPLERAFATGWCKLPGELKLQIIEANLVSAAAIDPQGSSSRTEAWMARTQPCPSLAKLYHHLRMTPEIAELAKRIFYTSNTFLLRTGWGRTFKYPKPAVNHQVRRLDVRVSLGDRREWKKLVKLADGDYGFKDLRFIQVTLHWGDVQWMYNGDAANIEAFKDWLNARTNRNVQFQCHGTLAFKHKIILEARTRVPEAVQQRFETIMRFKVGFAVDPLEDL
jgi:hypothetical protein